MKRLLLFFFLALLFASGCSSSVSTQSELEDCKVWFDGCNSCSVINGQIDACTEKACECLEPPCHFDEKAKCLEYY